MAVMAEIRPHANGNMQQLGLSGQWATQAKMAGSENRTAIGNSMGRTSAYTTCLGPDRAHSCRSSMELAKSAYLPKAANVFWLVQNSTKLLFSTVFGVAAIRLALGGN